MIAIPIRHHDGRRDVARPTVQIFPNVVQIPYGRSLAIDVLPAARELQRLLLEAPAPAAIAPYCFLLGPPFNVIVGTALAFLALWLVRTCL